MKKNKISDELMQKLILETDNPFIEDFDIRTGKFTYSKDFYIKLGLLITREHCSAREAFEQMGFDTTVLSANQMSCAANYAKKKLKDKNYTIDPSNYDGSVEPELMTGLTMEEELAYLKSRNLYLEVSLDLQKKSPLILMDAVTSLKKKGLIQIKI